MENDPSTFIFVKDLGVEIEIKPLIGHSDEIDKMAYEIALLLIGQGHELL